MQTELKLNNKSTDSTIKKIGESFVKQKTERHPLGDEWNTEYWYSSQYRIMLRITKGGLIRKTRYELTNGNEKYNYKLLKYAPYKDELYNIFWLIKQHITGDVTHEN
jgi:hypothetical protein